MARVYKRDARGRFAGGGGGGSGGSRKAAAVVPAITKPRKPRGLVPQRQAVAKGKAKLAAKEADPAASSRSRAAQKGALTKARKKLAAAKETGRRRTQVSGRTGVIRVRRRGKGRPAPQTGPASGIRRTTSSRRGPLALKANAIRTYTPRTPMGQMDAGLRKMNRAVDSIKKQQPKIREVRKRTDSLLNSIARGVARDIVDSKGKGVKADVARLMLQQESPRLRAAGRDVIKRRAGRAAAAAARGSKPAAKAGAIYDRQLAPVLPKGKGKGKNNIQPGPRNTTGKPKKKRKPRKKR